VTFHHSETTSAIGIDDGENGVSPEAELTKAPCDAAPDRGGRRSVGAAVFDLAVLFRRRDGMTDFEDRNSDSVTTYGLSQQAFDRAFPPKQTTVHETATSGAVPHPARQALDRDLGA
jgi:hypothetical protein